MRRAAVIASLALALHSSLAAAQSRAEEAGGDSRSGSPAQVLYKGVIGNLLEAVPLEKQERVQVQRFSSVLTSPLSGRSLAMALGVASPPLMVIGLLWGLWSANQIGEAESVAAQRLEGAQRSPTNTAPVALSALLEPVAIDGTTSSARPTDSGSGRPAAVVDLAALSQVVGGASANDRLVPCENCYMPLLYPRAAPDVR